MLLRNEQVCGRSGLIAEHYERGCDVSQHGAESNPLQRARLDRISGMSVPGATAFIWAIRMCFHECDLLTYAAIVCIAGNRYVTLQRKMEVARPLQWQGRRH